MRNWTFAAVLTLAWVAAPPAGAADPYHGKLLYETYCWPCHYGTVHFRPRRKVRDLDQMLKEIRIWQEAAGLEWSARDCRDVQSYLNSLYYGFPYYGGVYGP